MKTDDLENLFKESVAQNETQWTTQSHTPKSQELDGDRTQISFQTNYLSEDLATPPTNRIKSLIVWILWIAGAGILILAFKDLLGF